MKKSLPRKIIYFDGARHGVKHALMTVISEF
ncbi:hypothetical protein IMAU70023_03087 [Lactiplantibacillus plantarum]|nr:hypothetical protein [Lactiplantibacillus plantarum]MCG0616390.1 hypothetical protein [Lactiplantibacillus plantarum]MCG0712610.1 hypothetical protein [Lactiplantibacillus plantarum]